MDRVQLEESPCLNSTNVEGLIARRISVFSPPHVRYHLKSISWIVS
jgi:hypothetical protein